MAAPPPLPLTYTDALCGLDLDPLGRETGSDLQNLVQDVFHMLYELPGSNPDDEQNGAGVEQMLSGSTVALAQTAARIDRSLSTDTRIASSKTTLSQQPDGSYLIAIQIQATDGVIGVSFAYAAQVGLTFVGATGLSS